MIRPLFRALRPVQWVKNVFVLAPIVFAEQLGQADVLGRAMLAFIAFCAASSAVYLFNDLRDREEDRRHPLKKHRPIASGALSVPAAIVAALVLAASAMAAGARLRRRLRRPGADLLADQPALLERSQARRDSRRHGGLERLRLIRVLAGAAAIDVEVSRWLLLCTIFLALFLIFSKRRHELVLLADEAAGHRAVLHHYSPAFLDQMINVVTASTVVSYALYAVDDSTVERFGSRSAGLHPAHGAVRRLSLPLSDLPAAREAQSHRGGAARPAVGDQRRAVGCGRAVDRLRRPLARDR